MKSKIVPVFFLIFVLIFSGCFTSSLRTGNISTNDPVVKVSIGFQFAWEKDPRSEEMNTVQGLKYIFSSLLTGLGIEFGTIFFEDSSSGWACSLGLVFGLVQQDIHPRCGLLQEGSGDKLSIALGYKLSLNLLFADGAIPGLVNGNVVTMDVSGWIGNTFSPIFNLEIGKTIIPDKTEVRGVRDTQDRLYNSPEIQYIDAWMLKSTFGMGVRSSAISDASQFAALLGFTPIFRLDEPSLKGYEAAAVFQLE